MTAVAADIVGGRRSLDGGRDRGRVLCAVLLLLLLHNMLMLLMLLLLLLQQRRHRMVAAPEIAVHVQRVVLLLLLQRHQMLVANGLRRVPRIVFDRREPGAPIERLLMMAIVIRSQCQHITRFHDGMLLVVVVLLVMMVVAGRWRRRCTRNGTGSTGCVVWNHVLHIEIWAHNNAPIVEIVVGGGERKKKNQTVLCVSNDAVA